MRRTAIILALCAIPATAAADKRGQVVCGIPPDEAVAYVYESKSGVWDYIGPLARIVGDMGHPSCRGRRGAVRPGAGRVRLRRGDPGGATSAHSHRAALPAPSPLHPAGSGERVRGAPGL